ncbi:MAG: DUF1634 domain-containing protein [Acidobacteriota bacterium]|nr:DUF1634 domain-containing protein [Acidobacteriota bacterium]
MERALRITTWLAAALLLIGLGLWLAGSPPATQVLHAGLWLLIATPIVRVLMALTDYVEARDWKFVVLTAIVLACLFFPLINFAVSHPR